MPDTLREADRPTRRAITMVSPSSERLTSINAKGPKTIVDAWPMWDSYGPSSPKRTTRRSLPVSHATLALLRGRSSSRPTAKALVTSSSSKMSSKRPSSASSVDYGKMSLWLGVATALGGAAFMYWKYTQSQAKHEYRRKEMDAFHAMQRSAAKRLPLTPGTHATTGGVTMYDPDLAHFGNAISPFQQMPSYEAATMATMRPLQDRYNPRYDGMEGWNDSGGPVEAYGWE